MRYQVRSIGGSFLTGEFSRLAVNCGRLSLYTAGEKSARSSPLVQRVTNGFSNHRSSEHHRTDDHGTQDAQEVL